MRKLSPSLYVVLYILIATSVFILVDLQTYRKDLWLIILCLSAFCSFMYSKFFLFILLNRSTAITKFIYGVGIVICTALTVVFL